MRAQCCLSCSDPDCQRVAENQRLLDQAEYSAAERLQELKNQRSFQAWWFGSLTVAVAILGWVLIRVLR